MVRTLQQLRFLTGRLPDLVGDEWAHHYRMLHPARTQRHDEGAHVRWAEVAASRGVQVDLRSAAWHDVSGYRLHHPKATDTVGEPIAGPTSSVLLPVLCTLADCRDIEEVTLAEWNGYDEKLAGRQLEGARYQGTRSMSHLEYSLWQTTVAQAATLIESDRVFGCPPDRMVLANVIWDATEDWLVVADGDLASTYVATTFAVDRWHPDLEWVEVPADVPLG